jgi:hypothetical protein
MKKEAAKRTKKQGGIPAEMSMMLGQLVLPMMLASEAMTKGLLAFVQQIGLLAFRELLEGEVVQIAGPKGKHNASRTHHHWGTAETVCRSVGVTPSCSVLGCGARVRVARRSSGPVLWRRARPTRCRTMSPSRSSSGWAARGSGPGTRT